MNDSTMYHVIQANAYIRKADEACEEWQAAIDLGDMLTERQVPQGPFGSQVTINVGMANMHMRMAELKNAMGDDQARAIGGKA